jgi:hypothetical protein
MTYKPAVHKTLEAEKEMGGYLGKFPVWSTLTLWAAFIMIIVLVKDDDNDDDNDKKP